MSPTRGAGRELSDTDDLRVEQELKKADEERAARESQSEDDAKTHERRAEKSEYLREKLEERKQSEDQ